MNPLLGVLAFVGVTVLVALPLHLAGVRILGESKATEVRDFLWRAESLVVIVVAAVIAGVFTAYLFTFGYARIGGKLGPLIGVAFMFANLYSVPIALFTGFVAHVKWRKHRAPGSCSQCGYDLTGNTSGVCPECGRPTDQ
ncbi:MAG: hypothetical protein H6817_09645 [Phycisphaerales bacterium]|nr:hypothetical protein [Phycisphaerales bacterium]